MINVTLVRLSYSKDVSTREGKKSRVQGCTFLRTGQPHQRNINHGSSPGEREIHFAKFPGFTLLEILIALFIFAIVSSLIAVALRTVINAQSETEVQSARFRNLEMAWIIFANDIQQTTNRPILDASGRQEAAFIGLQASMTFTHMGWPNPRGELLRSTLQRTRYRLQDHTVLREIWPELDRGQAAIPLARPLLHDVAMLRFEYLDERGQSYAMWPVSKQPNLSPLPRAVRIIVVWVDGQKMSQLYVIPH